MISAGIKSKKLCTTKLMGIIIIYKFNKKKKTKISICLTLLFLFIFFGKASANCWTSDLSEEDQLAIARKSFEDGVFSASSETAKCYLDEFKNGKSREEMFFLRAEALRKGGDLQGSTEAYNELKKNFPQSRSYLDNAMLQQGISLTHKRKYPLAIRTLESLLKEYPKSKYRNETNYWLGYASSLRAESLRKKNKGEALNKYRSSIKYLNKCNPKSLTQKQKQKRWYLIGHAWWVLDKITNAAKAWEHYLKGLNYADPEKALQIKFQLASRFQRDKKFSESARWFARIVTDHQKSKFAVESSFWRAEMDYASLLQKNKAIPKKSSDRIVKHYNVYLEKNDETHRALAFYRIGTLEQNIRPINSISAFKNYLRTKDKNFSNEVKYRLAHLYINTKQPQKAIKEFKEYLSTGDKTYSDEVKYQLGYLYIDTKEPQKAIDIFKKYLDGDDNENSPEILIRLGYLYIDTKQPHKAIDIFKKYLDGDNKDYVTKIQISLGYLYIETKQIENAIQIFKKYLAGNNKEHYLEIKLRLAYLYIEKKQIFLAIALLEEVIQNPNYKKNKDILQTLLVLYRKNVSEEKYIQFLAGIRSDQKLEENIRREFQTHLILAFYQQKKCDKLILELNEKPGYLQKIKNLNPEEWEHLIFLKGSCLINTKKWDDARKIFRQTRESEKYRKQSIEMLLEAHRQLEDWKAITWEFQEIFDRNSPPMTIPYFQLWMFAAQKRKDFQRLDRIKIISDRWKEYFPEDSQNLSNINQYLSTSQIQELSKQGKWLEISTYIRKEVKSGKINLDEQIFSQLLYAEKKLENWEGILSAYTLLSIYDQKRAEELDSIINQAKAAEKLGKKSLSIEYYNKALNVKPANDYEKKTQAEIKEYLAVGIFQNLIEKEEWSKVSKIIHEEVKNNKRTLDQKNFDLLLYVENKKTGKKKYNGILAAYKLLSNFNKKKANTVDALLDQAKAAEELRKKKLAIKYYQKISKTIHKEVKEKKRNLDEKNFKLLLFTENKKPSREKYNGILDAYALLAISNKKKTLTVEALIDQGYAAEKLGGYKRAKGYYKSALKKVPEKKFELSIQLIGELTRLYERSNDYESLVQVYKRAYNVMKKNGRPKKDYQTYAYLIGYHYSTHLKQNKKARIWMMRADGGGKSEQELQAGFWVAQLDLEAKKTENAFKRLKELAGRKISKNSAIYSQIHFEIGTLYHFKEKWKLALRHFRFVANSNPPKKLRQLKADATQNVKDIDNYLKSIKASQ